MDTIPTEVDYLLEELRRRHWTMLRWGPADRPELVAWMFDHGQHTDVVILWSEDRAIGYRAPSVPGETPLDPVVVQYEYHSSALYVLRAMLSLPEPGAQGAPATTHVPRPDSRVPRDLPRPMVVRPLAGHLTK